MLRLVPFAAIAAIMLTSTAAAQSGDRRADAQQRAYTLSVVCWVVASYYRDEADIHRTTDALRKMGSAMGYDNARTSKDAVEMASALGVELRRDPEAMQRHRTACRKLGLVG
jgi:hypothetical protein